MHHHGQSGSGSLEGLLPVGPGKNQADVDRLVESHNSKLDVYFDWRVRNIDGPGDPFVALRRNVQLVPTGFEVSHIQRRITQESTIKKDLRAGDITCHSEYMG